MRSQQVFQALNHVPNRFALCRITSVALKRLHKLHARTQDTISDVLGEIELYKNRRPQPKELPVLAPALVATVTVAHELGLQNPPPVSLDTDLVFVGPDTLPASEIDLIAI